MINKDESLNKIIRLLDEFAVLNQKAGMQEFAKITPKPYKNLIKNQGASTKAEEIKKEIIDLIINTI